MGLLDEPYVDEDRAREVLGDPAHRDVARTAAERSAVLLRNEGGLLPLDTGSLGSIAVIGPLADSKRDTLGPWCFDFDLDETVTVLEGIRGKVGEAVKVEYAPGIRPAQRTFPLFPFGHGLSYSSFDYSNLAVDRAAIGPDEALTVSVDITNTGEREADEVVQLYIHQRYGSASRPVRELKGFQRISLGAGESRALQFTLGRVELSYWNAVARDWVLDASTFDIWAGGDSTAELSTTFEVNEA